jgi:hypothetical protein
LEFADGGVKRHGEGALTADQIRPLEFYPEAMPLLSNFERIRGEGDHVIAPIDLQYTFQGFIERRHYQYSSACRGDRLGVSISAGRRALIGVPLEFPGITPAGY